LLIRISRAKTEAELTSPNFQDEEGVPMFTSEELECMFSSANKNDFQALAGLH